MILPAPPPGLRSPRPLVRLWRRIRPFRVHLALGACALMGSAGTNLAFPLIARSMVDKAFLAGDRTLLDQIALGLVGLFLLQGVFQFVQTYVLSIVGERAIAGLRRDLFSRLLEMAPGFFTERRTGELLSRITTDVGLLAGVLSHQIAEAMFQVLLLVGGVATMLYLQPRLTLTAMGVVPITLAMGVYFGRRLRRMTVIAQDRAAEASVVAQEAFSLIRTVQSFVQEPFERRRYRDAVQAMVDIAIRRVVARGVFLTGVGLAMVGAAVGMLWLGGRFVLAGQLSLGALVAFFIYTGLVVRAVAMLVPLYSSYQEAVGAAERVFELLETRSSIADPPDPTPLPKPLRGRVTCENVSFRYSPDLAAPYVLRQISFQLEPGEVLAVVGPSGSGKTTLVSLLLRFWDVTEGRILLDGVDLRSLRVADLRQSIGLVPQEPALFSSTIRENIAYARPDATDAEVVAAARAAHADEFIERLPRGYDTTVGERGVKLSGGQRQRVAIARAILKDPALLILDEATSSLDTESERLVEEALERLLIGRTTLIIAHRLSTVQRADRLLVLDRGCIVEEGSHARLLARGGLYTKLYQGQFRKEETPAGP